MSAGDVSALRDEADHVEAADEIDLDDLPERVELMRPIPADRPRADEDAGTVDEKARFAEPARGFGDGGLATLGAAHVAADGDPADRRCHAFGAFHSDVENRDPGTAGGERA